MSPLDGFEYMAEGLEAVADDMEEARLLYLQPLVCGYYEGEDDIAEAVEELEKLGLDRYMEIIQKELDKHMKKTGRGTDG